MNKMISIFLLFSYLPVFAEDSSKEWLCDVNNTQRIGQSVPHSLIKVNVGLPDLQLMTYKRSRSGVVTTTTQNLITQKQVSAWAIPIENCEIDNGFQPDVNLVMREFKFKCKEGDTKGSLMLNIENRSGTYFEEMKAMGFFVSRQIDFANCK
jgi:hypothetical protein